MRNAYALDRGAMVTSHIINVINSSTFQAGFGQITELDDHKKEHMDNASPVRKMIFNQLEK